MTETGISVREGQGPLSGVTVLDLSGYVAGPYGCTLLGDLGAAGHQDRAARRRQPAQLSVDPRPREPRVPRRQPQQARHRPRSQASGRTGRIAADGRGRRTCSFTTSDPRSRRGSASTTTRMKAINPRLIYCALTGYGESGPLKDRAGYDQVLQTMTGISVEQGKPGDPQIVYGSAVDFYSASMLAFAVSAALFERSRTGEGQYVGVSLLRSALTMQATRLVWADGEGRDVARDMRSGGITGLHPTKSGSLYISANTPHFWTALCELTGLPELARDPRFDTVRKRAAHADEIVPRIRAALPGAYRARMGSAVRRARSLCGGAGHRGHVRPSAGGRRKASSRASSILASGATAGWRIRSTSAPEPPLPLAPRRPWASTRERSWRGSVTRRRRSSGCAGWERSSGPQRIPGAKQRGSPHAQQAVRPRIAARVLREGPGQRGRRHLIRPGGRRPGERGSPTRDRRCRHSWRRRRLGLAARSSSFA